MGNGHTNRGIGSVKLPFAEKQISEYNPTTKSLRSIYPAHLLITGPVSGIVYEWKKIGDINHDVLIEDADLLLVKLIGGRGCCGATQEGNRLFDEVE